MVLISVFTAGVVVTSASSNILGTLYWNPVELLAAIQEHYHSSSHGKRFAAYNHIYLLILTIFFYLIVRAAVFFGGFSLAISQLAINVVLNSVSTGMDIAGLWPRFINIRRGAFILGIVS